MKTKTLIAIAALTLLTSATYVLGQTIIFSDNFESGNLNNWTTSGTSPLTINNTQNAVPVAGTFSAYANLSLNRMHHNIIGDNGGVEVAGYSTLTTWLYDGSMTRAYVQALGYSGGTGLPNGGTTASGSLAQLFAIGKYSSVTMAGEVYDGTKYQARVLYPSATGGWFNLNAPGAPSRSPGWHKFTIERLGDGSTINFYVDDILGRTFTGATLQSWDTITMGFGTSSSSNGDAWYDGIVVTVPEPSSASLCVLGGLGIFTWINRRRSA